MGGRALVARLIFSAGEIQVVGPEEEETAARDVIQWAGGRDSRNGRAMVLAGLGVDFAGRRPSGRADSF